MTSERTEQALGRIDAALARIQHATQQAGAAATQAQEASAALARQHETLRAAVTDTLRDLDRLIGSQNAGGQS